MKGKRNNVILVVNWMNVFEILGFRYLIWFRLVDILSVWMLMILIKVNIIYVMLCIEEDVFYVVVFKIKIC